MRAKAGQAWRGGAATQATTHSLTQAASSTSTRLRPLRLAA